VRSKRSFLKRKEAAGFNLKTASNKYGASLSTYREKALQAKNRQYVIIMTL